MESSRRVVVVENVPFAHTSVNENKLYFPKEVLAESYKSMEGKPAVINLTGQHENDHVTNSSMNTIGWVKNARFDGYTAWCDVEVTNPEVGDKLLRTTTDGMKEINGVSMGAEMSPLCSVCGQMMDKTHEHARGETYDGRTAIAIANDVKFNHLAFTNFQADLESTLNNSKVYPLEISSIKIKQWKVKEMATIGPVAEKAAEMPTPEAPSMEERMQKLEECVNQLMASKQQAEVVPGGQADVPKTNAIAAEEPKAVETQKDEEEEKKKYLEQVSAKYKTKLLAELAVRMNRSTKEYATRTVEQLEAMLDVLPTATKKVEVAQHGTNVETGSSKAKSFKEMSAKERAETYGFAKSLEMAYKHDTGQLTE